MFKSFKAQKKIVAIWSLFSITLNIFQPAFVAISLAPIFIPQKVNAQEVPPSDSPDSQEPTVAPVETPAVVEPTISISTESPTDPSADATSTDSSLTETSTQELMKEPSDNSTLTTDPNTPVNPTPITNSSPAPPESDIEPVVAESSAELVTSKPDLIKTISLSQNETVTESSISDWNVNESSGYAETKEKVKLGVKYVFPLENNVTLTFNTLPTDAQYTSKIKIEKVKVSDLNLPDGVNPSGEYAYDITTSMVDGSFDYDLTLPKSNNKVAEVVYMESEDSVPQLISGDQTSQDGDKVKATDINHFTIFVVINPVISGSTCVSAGATTGTGCYATIQEAIDASNNNDTIEIQSDITLSQQVNVNKDVTINGNGFTVSPAFAYTSDSNNSSFNILSDGATLSNMTVDGVTGSDLHGINVYVATNVLLDNVSVLNNDKAGVVVNGSIVTVNNINTSGNGWGGINVDQGDGVITEAELIIDGTSSHSESLHIWIDDNTKNVSVKDSSPPQYKKTDYGIITVYTLKVSSSGNPSASLSQFANDAPEEWVNGNLGASKATYYEGDSVPYRLVFGNLSSASHTITIEWDTTKSGKHAEDFLTSYDRTVASADPCIGVTPCASPTTFPIPVDSQVNGAGVTQIPGNFTLYGGTITGVSAYSYADGTGFTGDKSARITITFTAAQANPVLAWGGHIAHRQNWGADNSAISIPGSPYHMRLIDLDGKGGNQDRSLSADAVIFPASITIVKQATPEGPTSFSFTASPSPLTNFNLIDDGSATDTKSFSNITNFQTYTVTETVPSSSWSLNSIVCNVNSENGGSQNVSKPGVSINLKEGENVTCTFANAQQSGSITIVKNANGGDSSFDFTSKTLPSASFSLTTVNGTASTPFNNLSAGIYDVSETVPTGWSLSSATCNDGSPITAINLAGGENITCTFTNTRQTGKIELQKDFVGTSESVTIQIGSSENGNQITSTTISTDGTTSEQTVETGTYFVSEILTTPSNYDATLACYNDINNSNSVDNGDTSHLIDSLTGAVSVGNNDDVLCVITNTRKTGKLFIDKILVGGGPATDSSWTFNIYSLSGSLLGTLTDDSVNDWIVLETGSYSVVESNNVPGYTISTTGGVCANTLQDRTATATVSTGDSTCSFTNVRDIGSLKVNKQVDTNGDDTYDGGNTEANTIGFDWTLNSGSSNDMGATLSNLPTTVDGLVYSVTENIGSFDEYNFTGWYTNGSQFTCANPEGTSLPITVSINKNATTEITLCNKRETGTITIIKDALPNSSQDFSFTTNIQGVGNFNLDDDSNGTLPNSRTFTVVTGSNYAITESSISGWQLTDLVCSGDDNGSFSKENRQAIINLDSGENVTCTFTNTQYGSIQGRKYNDVNGNGDFDSTEKVDANKLSGWTINLYKDGSIIKSMVTGNDSTEAGNVEIGQYRFINLLPGTYDICEVSQTGWVQTEPSTGVQHSENTICHTVTLSAGQAINTIQFGNFELGKLSGYKWYDVDADSVWDDGELALSGWTINLGNQTDVTDATGFYEFTDLASGSYALSETMQDGWEQTTAPSTPVVVTSGTNLTNQNFGNRGALSLTACKWEDSNGLSRGGNFSSISGWDMTLGSTTQSTTANGCTTFTNLIPGSYSVTEETQDGWNMVDSSATKNVELTDEDVTVDFYNYQYGTISGYKWNDINGNGERDCEFTERETQECEDKLSNWVIFIDEAGEEEEGGNEIYDLGELTTTTDEDGNYIFENLEPGEYTVCEQLQTGWMQTFPLQPTCHTIVVTSGEDEEGYNFGNQAEPVLRIQKTNDAEGAKNPGDIVTYTLTLDLDGSDLTDVIVKDVTPDGFTYIPGSWTVTLNGESITIEEPNYASPGTWTLGDMNVGDVIVLTYKALINANQDAGNYNDLAWAQGNSAGWGTVLAEGHDSEYVDADGTFVGTDVQVNRTTQQTGSVKIEAEGQVLGASTELPATGAETGWLYLAIGALITGLFLIFGGKRMKIIAMVLAGFAFLVPAQKVSATSTDNMTIRIEQPASPTRLNEWKLSFSVLDRDEGTPVVRCYVKKPNSGSFTQFGATHTSSKPEGDNGNCQVNSSVIGEQGNYVFYVNASTEGASENSAEVTVNYDTSGPGTPTYYSKEHPSSCKWIIKFHTADDNGATTKVEIYSSDQKNFDTHNGTRVGSVNIGSNQDGSFTHDRADGCDKEWFYVIRAFDSAGNQSNHRGDEMVSVTTVTPSPTTGALVVTSSNGSILGKSDDKAKEENKAEEPSTPSAENVEKVEGQGLVAGASDTAQKLVKNKTLWWIILIIIILRIVYGFAKNKIKK